MDQGVNASILRILPIVGTQNRQPSHNNSAFALFPHFYFLSFSQGSYYPSIPRPQHLAGRAGCRDEGAERKYGIKRRDRQMSPLHILHLSPPPLPRSLFSFISTSLRLFLPSILRMDLPGINSICFAAYLGFCWWCVPLEAPSLGGAHMGLNEGEGREETGIRRELCAREVT